MTNHEHISTYSRPGLIRQILGIPQDIVNFVDGDDPSHVTLSHDHIGGGLPHHHDLTPLTSSIMSDVPAPAPIPEPAPVPTPAPIPENKPADLWR